MHLKLIHVSHCCRTWREMPLPTSESVSFALLFFPSLGRSSTAFTAIVYCQAINNRSLRKRHPLLHWSQHPKRLRVQINSGFPGSEVSNLLCALGNNRMVSRLCSPFHLNFSRRERELAADRAVLSPLQIWRHSLSFSERKQQRTGSDCCRAKDLCFALSSARQEAQSCARELLALAGTVGGNTLRRKSYWRVKEPEGRRE